MPIRLDERLYTVACLAAGARTVCDIGCDHGKLACYMVQTGRAERAVATDISAPSLKKAEELIAETGLADLVTTRIGDGLDPIADGEADTVVIAGMGGDLIASILERATEQGKRFERYILSPNTHPERVREQVAKSGHVIVHDARTECAGKKYTVILTQAGEGESLDAMQMKFGKFFRVDPAFRAEAERELAVLERTVAENPDATGYIERAKELRAALGECGI